MGAVSELRRVRSPMACAACCASLLTTLVAASPVHAQSASAPLQLNPVPTDDGLGERGAVVPFAAFTPLRLSLAQGLFPIGDKLPGCDSREDASGNSINGFPIERYSYLRLTPRLTLHGFSSGGCLVDAGIGGGLSYSSPLGKNLWLVSSVGFYGLPPVDPVLSAVVSTAARVDVVKQLPTGHYLNVGLGTRNRTGAGLFNAVSFGGNF